MQIRRATTLALVLCAASGCATTENTGIPEPTKADAAESGGAANDAAVADSSNAQPPIDEPKPIENPAPETVDQVPVSPDAPASVSGLEAKPEGTDAAWKSGQPAAQITRARRTEGDAIPAPTRDGQSHRYELRAYGTEIEVFADGQPVSAERIVIHGNSVGVLDANGKVIEKIDLPEHWAQDSQASVTPKGDDPYDFRDVKGNKLTPPKVMLGGRLVDPSTAVLKHLSDRGVRRQRVSMVTNVIPDLPLALAGVENDDIVLAVNEVPDADPGTIRAVLRTMKPGESITLRLLRGTQILDAKVVAAAWDPKHMVRPLGTGGHTPVASEASGADGAGGTNGQPSVAKLEEELVMAKQRIAALEKQLNDADPVRKSVRPAAVPAPTSKPKAP